MNLEEFEAFIVEISKCPNLCRMTIYRLKENSQVVSADDMLNRYIEDGHNFIACIKYWRYLTGATLHEAKAKMDNIRDDGKEFGTKEFLGSFDGTKWDKANMTCK